MAEQRVSGRDLRIYFGEDTATSPIFASTSCELSLTWQTEKTVDKDTPKTGLQELTSYEWTLTSNNIVATGAANGFEQVMDASLKGEEVSVSFKLGEGFSYSGKAIITSVSSSAPAEGKATFTATFTGSGELKKDVQTPGI